MPARISRKVSAAATGTSSLTRSKKRAVDEAQSPSSRSSKRTRVSAASDLPSSLASDTPVTLQQTRQNTTESSKATIISPSSSSTRPAAASKIEVNVEKTEGTIQGSQRTPRTVKKRISYAEDESSVNGAKEEEKKAIVHEKTTRKRKTKEEKEAVMAPLAARTKGLQMFVGAHVSAAKGMSPLRGFAVHRLSVKLQILGVQNSVLNSVQIG